MQPGHRGCGRADTDADRGGPKLRRFARQSERRDRCKTIGDDGVIASVAVASAGFALLFDVGHFSARRHFAVPAHDAAATESSEPEKPNETHDALRFS